MRFFERLFGSVSESNSDENNDYARATFEFATSSDIYTSDEIVYTKREPDLKTKGKNDGPSQIIPNESLTSKPKVNPRSHQDA
ncbi:MAG: hypothetical protein GY845_04820 [Planctomycetes bacterium]|nr:hypothetical protein [Planctomycetota bacterium]